MSDDKPERLYKYLTGERIDVLRNGTVRFTQPSALNDPFEHAAKLDGVFERPPRAKLDTPPSGSPDPLKALFRTAFGAFIKMTEQPLRKVGFPDRYAVLSLAEHNDNLLMWAHYAEEHRGFVIEFDTSHPFFDRGAAQEDCFNHLQEVTYQLDRPTLSLERYSQSLLFKSPHWEYEQEWRMIVPTKEATEAKDTSVGKVFLYRFPPECVSAIILGSRMPEAVVEEFFDLVMNDERYAHVGVRFAQEEPDQYALRIGGGGRIHYHRALNAMESEDEEELLKQLDLAIDLEPENAEYHFLRGTFAFLSACAGQEFPVSTNLDAARQDLEQAVDLNPLEARYWRYLHDVTFCQGDYGRALEAVERAIERSEEDAGLVERRARLLLHRQSYVDSIRDCTRAIGLNPTLLEAHWVRARAYHGMGRFDEAMADTDRAIELAPEDVRFYKARAQLWEARGSLEHAQADLSHALELQPDQVDALVTRARLRDTNGDVESARRDIDRALELQPGDADLSRIRAALGSADAD